MKTLRVATASASLSRRNLAWRLALLALALLGLGACAHNRTEYRPICRFYDEKGEPMQVKRRARFETLDLRRHWSREVYVRPQSPFTILVSLDDKDYAVRFDRNEPAVRQAPNYQSRFSLDQQKLIVAHGVPDYVRPPFVTYNGEQAIEWLFQKANLLAQFVDGELVFSGPITDKEKLLLRMGYPNFRERIAEDVGPARETLIYRDREGTDLAQFDFADDALIMRTE